MFYAIKNNNSDIVKKLINVGSDLSIKDINERTPLKFALDCNMTNVAKLLGYTNEIQEYENNNLIIPSYEDILNEVWKTKTYSFYLDVENTLGFSVCRNKQKKVTLTQFLNCNEQDLYDMGFIFSHDRKKILKFLIHVYHLQPWKKSSMPLVSKHLSK